MSSRQELFDNAIAFLTDPKSQASSLAQRIQFLEAKGLTPAEIDMAVKQAALKQGPQPQPAQASYTPGYGQSPYTYGSGYQQHWDWRDYFITAVVSGTVVYSAVTAFKKYLLPHLQPPTSTAYEEDREALSAQFDAAEATLKDIQEETAAIRAAVDDQKEKIDKTVEEVEAAIKEMRQGEIKTRDGMREIRDEVDNVKEMFPRMLEKNKEGHAQSLTELHQELKSLKALLLSRGPSNISSPAPSFPPPTVRPTIPSWQLAASSASDTTPAESNSGSTLLTNGKGKEVADGNPSGMSTPGVSS